MRIVSVATSDRGGGAEKVAWEVFTGLEERGHESWLLVGQKKSDHPRVIEIHSSPWFDYRPYSGRIRQRFWQWKRDRRRRKGQEDFVYPYSRKLLELLPELPEAVLAHNLHGGFFDLRGLPGIARRVPTAVVLHDYWLLTGHCAFPLDCRGWQNGCGNCPDLTLPPAIEQDSTRANLRLKKRIYRRSRLTVCSPSLRVLEDVKRSELGPAGSDPRHIPNGVDLKQFTPGDRKEARSRVGWPELGFRLLLVGFHFDTNPFKDYACALATARRLDEKGVDVSLVILGGAEHRRQFVGNVVVETFPYETAPERVADYYRAADLLLHPTRSEVAPLVLSEALACGLPVVASDAGNARELVGQGGSVVPVGDAEAHAEAVLHFHRDAAFRAETGKRARLQAERSGGRERMLDAYEALMHHLARRSDR